MAKKKHKKKVPGTKYERRQSRPDRSPLIQARRSSFLLLVAAFKRAEIEANSFNEQVNLQINGDPNQKEIDAVELTEIDATDDLLKTRALNLIQDVQTVETGLIAKILEQEPETFDAEGFATDELNPILSAPPGEAVERALPLFDGHAGLLHVSDSFWLPNQIYSYAGDHLVVDFIDAMAKVYSASIRIAMGGDQKVSRFDLLRADYIASLIVMRPTTDSGTLKEIAALQVKLSAAATDLKADPTKVFPQEELITFDGLKHTMNLHGHTTVQTLKRQIGMRHKAAMTARDSVEKAVARGEEPSEIAKALNTAALAAATYVQGLVKLSFAGLEPKTVAELIEAQEARAEQGVSHLQDQLGSGWPKPNGISR